MQVKIFLTLMRHEANGQMLFLPIMTRLNKGRAMAHAKSLNADTPDNPYKVIELTASLDEVELNQRWNVQLPSAQEEQPT